MEVQEACHFGVQKPRSQRVMLDGQGNKARTTSHGEVTVPPATYKCLLSPSACLTPLFVGGLFNVCCV